MASLQSEVHSLQAEVKEKILQEDKKIKELKKAERQLKQQNATLNTKLSIAQVIAVGMLQLSTIFGTTDFE